MNPHDVIETRKVIHNGRALTVEFWYDNSMGCPWKENDGHGPVRECRDRSNKEPGERVFGNGQAYDWQASIKLAKKEGWYDCIDTFMELTAKFKRVPTRGMIAEHAVEKDFEHLSAWCEDEWHWMGVSVTDDLTGQSDHCGGYESTEIDTPYINERVEEMCEGLYMPSVEATLLSA